MASRRYHGRGRFERAVDVLINNAGISTFVPMWRPAENSTTTASPQRHRALLPDADFGAVMSGEGASIINISSYFAHKMLPRRPSSLYSLSKGALNSLTKAMAYELAPRGIRVNAIAPGTVDTELRRRTIAEMRRMRSRLWRNWCDGRIPWAGSARPATSAASQSSSPSQEAAWTTGAIFAIDGGLTIT